MREPSLLEELRREHRALVAVNVYDAMGAVAVVEAATAKGHPALIQTGSSAFSFTGLAPLAALAVAVRDESPVPVGVHLDHCRDIAQVRACLDHGYDSVMFDGSHLPLAENIRQTSEAAAVAHSYGAWIEAELGATAGDEDRSTDSRAGAFTDAAEAQSFVEATGVDALAIAIGNVHGVPSTPVRLALGQLAEIQETVQIPLVLHGASGLPDSNVQAAIELGIAKINVNAEVRRAYLAALHRTLCDSTSDDLVLHFSTARDAAVSVIRSKIRAFASAPVSGGSRS